MFRFWPELKENRQKERDPRSLRGPSVSGSDDLDQNQQSCCPQHHTDAANVVGESVFIHFDLRGDRWGSGLSGAPSAQRLITSSITSAALGP